MFFEEHGYHGTSFEQTYRCYPASFIEKPELESGDKIIMPPSVRDHLESLLMDHPMLFELRNDAAERVSHCTVLEFIAEEGMIYMPYWMMENMLLPEGDTVRVKNVTLPKGTYVKLQLHTMDFLDISNPKAILDTIFRNFSCLTTGDSVMVAYNNKKYYIDIIETKPANAISIVEADCEVDFAPPMDYKKAENPIAPLSASKAPDKDATIEVSCGPLLSSSSSSPQGRVIEDAAATLAQKVSKSSIDAERVPPPSVDASVVGELDQLTAAKHLNTDRIPLLSAFFTKYPVMCLVSKVPSSKIRGYAYTCLADFLAFLNSCSEVDAFEPRRAKFVDLLQDIRCFPFDKEWLDSLEACSSIFSPSCCSFETLQDLRTAKLEGAQKSDALSLEINLLTQRLALLQEQRSSSQAFLDDLTQQESRLSAAHSALNALLDF